MRIIIICIICVVLIAIIAYTTLVHKKAKQNVWAWWNTFMATVSSIIVAFAVGMLIYYYQSNADDEKKKKQYYELLCAEMSDVIDNLENAYTITVGFNDSSSAKAGITFLQTVILEDAGRSGLFDLRDSRNMLHIATEAKIYNLHISHLLSLFSIGPKSAYSENLTRLAMGKAQNTRETLLKHCSSFVKQMGLDTSQYWKQFIR